jgi:long-chain acyl-CoA synthetase
MDLLRRILLQTVKSPTKLAAVDDQRSYRRLELTAAAYHIARAVRRQTDKPHVGIMLPTSGGFPAALMGTWLAGRAAVPLNYLLKPEELRYVAEDSGIDTLITVDKMLELFGGGEALPPGLNLLKLDHMSFKGMPPVRWPGKLADDRLAVLLYTSGTSGKPKGVRLSHGNLRANVDALRQFVDEVGEDPSVFLGVLPQFHAFGLTALTLWPLAGGKRVVYSARFVPRRVVELIEEHRPDVFVAIPSMFGALLSVKSMGAEQMSSIRFPISGAEPLPAAVRDGIAERTGLQILEGYGLTETSPVTNCNRPGDNKPGTVGRAIPGVRNIIVGPDNQPLPAETDGEILIAGGNVMQGYHGLPDQTDAVLGEMTLPGESSPTRVFRTGDQGRLDADGFLSITGRIKEMLIVGGENVFPREIEEVLVQHPAVGAAAVIGRPDDMRGETPAAFVELIEDPPEPFDEAIGRAWCRDRLAAYKVPRTIRVIDKLPRNPTGKVLRRDLKPMLDD